MWVICVLVLFSQPLTSIFGLVNSSIKKMRLECCLHPSHSMAEVLAYKINPNSDWGLIGCLFQRDISPWKRGSEGPKYCEVTAYDFMTFYDFTAYKCTAHDFRPDDFTTYVLGPVENVSVSPIFFPNSIKGWTLFIIWWTLSIIWWTLSIILCTPTH